MRRRGRALAAWLTALLLAGCAPATEELRLEPTPAGEEAAVTELRERREEARGRWEALADEATGLERYARFVQDLVDAAAARARADGGGREEAVKRAFLDDLVDLSVPPEFDALKRTVMSSEPSYDGPRVHEDESGLEGFAERFRPGEGRYRHLAMSAAAAYRYPGPLVEVAARLVGGDLVPEDEAEGDSAADLATNDVGRRFAAFLQRTPLAGLADGESVAAWLRRAFGAE